MSDAKHPTILVVGMTASVHVARWLAQIADQGWDVHLFPSIDNGMINPMLKNITVHRLTDAPRKGGNTSVHTTAEISVNMFILARQTYKIRRWVARKLHKFITNRWSDYHVRWLRRVIRRLQPDVIHSIEFQHGAYLTLGARQGIEDIFPPWIVSSYGSDIYLFGRLAEHEPRVRDVLAKADFLQTDCKRDVSLAHAMGFSGQVLPTLPVSAGINLPYYNRFRNDGPTSARRLIMLKGYQHWAGRALFGLKALALCADVLQDYRIAIYSATPDVILAAEITAQETGLQIDIIPHSPNDEILRLFGQARVYLGISISDGSPLSMLEAMTMGAFPIQSCTACADEWITDGESGFIVPPEDPHIIAAALRRAVTEDDLVDRAAAINDATCAARLDRDSLRPVVVSIYETALGIRQPGTASGTTAPE